MGKLRVFFGRSTCSFVGIRGIRTIVGNNVKLHECHVESGSPSRHLLVRSHVFSQRSSCYKGFILFPLFHVVALRAAGDLRRWRYTNTRTSP
jgi:hypothetical protein